MDIIVHGGADSKPENPETRQEIIDESAKKGGSKSSPIDAVEAAITHLEHSELFNAGRGGAVQSDGVIRTDAGIMTSSREIGAVCSLTGVEHPVSVARLVLEKTPHTLISGPHAADLAEAFGITTDVDLSTQYTKDYLINNKPEKNSTISDQLDYVRSKFDLSEFSGGNIEMDTELFDHDTVGAVACDGEHFACATSTGGRWSALAGRVGDAPQVGSGFYCNPVGGASATGSGEDILRVTLSRRAVYHLENGYEPQEAAELAVEKFSEITGGTAGIIVLNADSAGSAFNSETMQTSIVRN